MTTCHLCHRPAVSEWLDFGPQPLTNRFPVAATEWEYTHPLAIGVCGYCGVVQLDKPMPAAEMRPRVDWISYNEPEGHLEQLCDDLPTLPGLTPQARICGISYKDDSTLRRLTERGFANTWRLDMAQDLGIHDSGAGIETIQNRLTPEAAGALVKKYGQADVVIMRHILEHAHDLHRLLLALRYLLRPTGYLVFEVPDAQRALDRLDYSTVWEEHTFYFTPATLKNAMALTGFEVAYSRSFPYTLEDSLVVAVRPRQASLFAPLTTRELVAEEVRARRFLRQFPTQKAHHQAFFANQQRTRGKIAFLGAGHLSAAFVNYFELKDLVACMVDDHPKKKGLFMPGSRLPIYGAEALVDKDIKLCCMSVRPEIEAKVVEKNHRFIANGGIMASIFPDSPYALGLRSRAG